MKVSGRVYDIFGILLTWNPMCVCVCVCVCMHACTRVWNPVCVCKKKREKQGYWEVGNKVLL